MSSAPSSRRRRNSPPNNADESEKTQAMTPQNEKEPSPTNETIGSSGDQLCEWTRKEVVAAPPPPPPPLEERPILDQQLFDKTYHANMVDLTLGNRFLYQFKLMGKWKRPEWFRFFSGRMPITKWLPEYNWREWTTFDIIGGLMVSIMTVPQGLAYGYLVGVPPNYGLITSIFGPFIYAMFGSSRHTSPGSFAIVSLMVGSVVEQFSGSTSQTISAEFDNSTECDVNGICCFYEQVHVPPADAINTACAVTLMVGIFQIIFGLLNAGILAVWLSDHLVMGLTSGAAIHVFTSQLKSATGISKVPPTSEPFGIITFYLCFFTQLDEIKWSSFITFLISVFMLLVSSYLIDPIHKKWTKGKFKFPMELFLVVGSILVVYLGRGTRFQIDIPIVGEVESGLVAPRLPNMSRMFDMMGSAISIAVVSFVIHIALAKLISKQLKYEIDANQEWLALGLMHLLSSFFGCFAGGSSLGRSMMQKNLQTKSQLSTIVCCVILVAVVFGGATLVYYLPKAVLAAIVVMAMKDLFCQIGRGFRILNQSIVDCLIFVVTFMSVVLINVNFGLIVGVAFALLSVVFRSQWADYTRMGRIPGTSEFKGVKHYMEIVEEQGIRIFRFDAPVYFANAELFIKSLHTECGVNPYLIGGKVKEKIESEKHRRRKISEEKVDHDGKPLLAEEEATEDIRLALHVNKDQVTDVTARETNRAETPENQLTEQLTHIIIDCSTIAYVDISGMNALAQVFADFAAISVTVLYAQCKVAVRQFFERSDFYKQVPKNRMFVSLDDAVLQAKREQAKLLTEKKEPTPARATTNKQIQPVPVAHSPPQKTIPKKELIDSNPQITQSGRSTSKTQSNTDVATTKARRTFKGITF